MSETIDKLCEQKIRKMKDEWYELTDKYIRNQMSEQEKNDFRQLLEQDEAFRKFFELEKHILAGVLSAPIKKQSIKNELNTLRAIDRRKRARSRKMEYFKWASMAACLTFLLMMGINKLFFNSSNPVTSIPSRYQEGDGADSFEKSFKRIPFFLKKDNKLINTNGKILLSIDYFESNEGSLYHFASPVLKIYTSDQEILDAGDLSMEIHVEGDQPTHFLVLDAIRFHIEETEGELPLKPIEK